MAGAGFFVALGFVVGVGMLLTGKDFFFFFREKEAKTRATTRYGKSPLSPIPGTAAHDHVVLAVIGRGLGRRALPRSGNRLRDLPALAMSPDASPASWLRGRNDRRSRWKITLIPSGQAESSPGGGYCQPRTYRQAELLL